MAKQLTIKQIAALAGVSAGTVDRVLHNRGRVSQEAMSAVQNVLDGQAYKYNLHTSAVAFKKTKKSLRILVSIPSSEKGEYWDLIKRGIDNALNEYSDFDIENEYIFFDQFNSLSCQSAFEAIAAEDCSAVILGTTFIEETVSLCRILKERHIPYVFVDGSVSGTKPVATFRADQEACGHLMARLMDGLTPKDKELALLLPKRMGTQLSNNSAIRLSSFKSYFSEESRSRAIREEYFSANSKAEAKAEILSFLHKNPEVAGIAVVISTGYIIADAFKDAGITDIVLGGFDVTDGNARCVKEGTLDFLINQHPETQGFNALESMLHYLLYGAPDNTLRQLMPIDIVFKENIPFWHDV